MKNQPIGLLGHRRLAVRSVAGNVLPLVGERVEAGAAVALGPGPAGLRNGLQTLAADLVVAFGPLYREKIKSRFRLASTSKMRALMVRKTPSNNAPLRQSAPRLPSRFAK
jgi:hypothetical protein